MCPLHVLIQCKPSNSRKQHKGRDPSVLDRTPVEMHFGKQVLFLNVLCE